MYQLLDAAKIEKNLCAIAQKSESIPESQLRELTKLELEQQREIYSEAVKTALNGKPLNQHKANELSADSVLSVG